jgi:hypothetical protein
MNAVLKIIMDFGLKVSKIIPVGIFAFLNLKEYELPRHVFDLRVGVRWLRWVCLHV